MQVHVDKNIDELADHVARWMVVVIKETLVVQERFTLALSGGGTPLKLHKLLAKEPYVGQIDWNKIHIFWGDERAVPFEDERNNAKMAFDSLLNFVPIPKEQIHLMDTAIDPGEAAKSYEALLHQYFDDTPHSFDLVLLGMGDDGHTLSLFPGMPILKEKAKWADAFFLPAQDMYRITITAPVTNLAKKVAFMAAGAGKAAVLKEVLEGPFLPELYPSQLIKPTSGSLHWFIDEAAAAHLKR